MGDKNLEDQLKSMDERMQELESRISKLEDQNETKVRVVDTDNGKKMVLENRQQTWFSPNYFRKILERMDEEDE
ncbi:MAG: hypothetical protein MUP58_01185 [Candidatus Nanohaloarchaeota archaeon QJJ-9]|nr:hypothetical protein [Candidatus Nanohaloarchaeota archaeon QJJ-9]